MLLEYVYDRKNRRVGVVVAVDNGRVGWSRVNRSKGDIFDKKLGIDIATSRAIAGWGRTVQIPGDVTNIYDKMADRARRYFKVGQTA